jgi:hypothetical protein
MSAQRSLPFCLSPVAGSKSRNARHTGMAEQDHVSCRKRP